MFLNSNRTLFICCTPFQLWLVQHIIRQKDIQDYTVVCTMRKGENHQKFKYYYDALTNKDKHSLFIKETKDFDPYKKLSELAPVEHQALHQSIRNTQKIFLPLQGQKFASVYIANYEKWIFSVMLSQIHFKTIYSFDDGSRNFLSTHDIPPAPTSLIEKYKTWKAKKSLGLKYTPSNLYAKIYQHYTINASLPNAVNKPLVQINLPVPTSTLVSSQFSPKIRIFVGQPGEAHSISNAMYSRVEENICSSLAVDYYFPHPRNTATVNNINTINTPLIFEDWITQQVNLYPNTLFEIYTLFSSIALTVPQSKNTHITALDIGIFPELYNVFEKSGIVVRDFKNQFAHLLENTRQQD